MNVKQVIVIRKELSMRKGKIGAQSAHASMKVLFDSMTVNGDKWTMNVPQGSYLKEWLSGGFTKICLACNSEEELDALYTKAKSLGLPVAMIVDSGKTEFNNVPTKTCIAIGPHSSDKIDKVTGNLKLM